MPGLHELIVALGDRRYRVERPFGSWPKNEGFVTDVAVDGRGHVFVGLRHDPLTQADDPRIIELGPDGAHRGGWGGSLIADTHLMTIAPDGRLFVVDRDMHEVVICTTSGERLGGLGRRGEPLRPFNHPSDVASRPPAASSSPTATPPIASTGLTRGSLPRVVRRSRPRARPFHGAACALGLRRRARGGDRPLQRPGAGLHGRRRVAGGLGGLLPAGRDLGRCRWQQLCRRQRAAAAPPRCRRPAPRALPAGAQRRAWPLAMLRAICSWRRAIRAASRASCDWPDREIVQTRIAVSTKTIRRGHHRHRNA